MVEVNKKENETIEALLRRFKKQLQRNGLLLTAREKMFYKRPKSKRKIREEAIKRRELREEKEYLRRIGKLK